MITASVMKGLNIFGFLLVNRVILHMRTIFEGHDFISIFPKVSYWTVFDKDFIATKYLMDPIVCGFSTKVRFKY